MGKVTKISTKGERQDNRRGHLREVAGDFDTPLGTVGQELRGARISRGEDIDTVSRILKIKKEHLEALEDDNISALPGRTYAVGFIRAYAEHLGLSPADTVERFKTEIAGRHDPSKTAGFKEPEELPGLSSGWIFVAIVVLGLVAYGVYYLFASTGTAPQQPVATVAPPPVIAKQEPSKPQRPAAAPVSNNTASRQTALQQPSAAPLPQPQVYGKWNLNPRIVLRIKEPTHILVQDEKGTEFINKVLEPGDSYQVANRSGLSLTAEHGNAVELYVDGKRVGMAGNSSDLTTALRLDADKLAHKSQAVESDLPTQ